MPLKLELVRSLESPKQQIQDIMEDHSPAGRKRGEGKRNEIDLFPERLEEREGGKKLLRRSFSHFMPWMLNSPVGSTTAASTGTGTELKSAKISNSQNEHGPGKFQELQRSIVYSLSFQRNEHLLLLQTILRIILSSLACNRHAIFIPSC